MRWPTGRADLQIKEVRAQKAIIVKVQNKNSVDRMLVMGSNSWTKETPKKALVALSLKWAEGVKSKGVAELRGAWIDMDKKLLWCYWETDNLEALQAEFDELNKQTDLVSELSVVEQYYPT